MYEREFAQIIECQRPHHPPLTDDLVERLRGAIFYQKPVRVPKSLIGKCSLEPGSRRAR